MISNKNENELGAEESSQADHKQDNEGDSVASGGVTDGPTRHQQPVPLSFPLKLMEILSDDTNTGIIHWLPHGRGFVVADKKKFAAEIMPEYFSRSTKYTSFTRKLNRWNFTRVTRGPETGAYYHPKFQRGQRKMCEEMNCLDAPKEKDVLDPVALGVASVGSAATTFAAANDAIDGSSTNSQAVLQLQLQQQAMSMTMDAMRHNQQPGMGVTGSSPSEAASWPGAQQQQLYNLLMQSQQQYLIQNHHQLNEAADPTNKETQSKGGNGGG